MRLIKKRLRKGLEQAKIDAENAAEYNYIKRKNERLLKQQEPADSNNLKPTPPLTEHAEKKSISSNAKRNSKRTR